MSYDEIYNTENHAQCLIGLAKSQISCAEKVAFYSYPHHELELSRKEKEQYKQYLKDAKKYLKVVLNDIKIMEELCKQ